MPPSHLILKANITQFSKHGFQKSGCELNILGMDFLNFATKSIEFTTPKMNLKIYPNVSITLSKYQTKGYSFVSKFEKVVVNRPFELAPKYSRVLTIRP